jgi:hypothetical protein
VKSTAVNPRTSSDDYDNDSDKNDEYADDIFKEPSSSMESSPWLEKDDKSSYLESQRQSPRLGSILNIRIELLDLSKHTDTQSYIRKLSNKHRVDFPIM